MVWLRTGCYPLKYVINNCIYLSLYFVYYDYSILNSFCVDLRTLFLMQSFLPIITTHIALAHMQNYDISATNVLLLLLRSLNTLHNLTLTFFPSRFFISLLFWSLLYNKIWWIQFSFSCLFFEKCEPTKTGTSVP